jgi:hypothetical protein
MSVPGKRSSLQAGVPLAAGLPFPGFSAQDRCGDFENELRPGVLWPCDGSEQQG